VNLIQKDRLLKDLASGRIKSNFVDDYKHSKLDVVSIAEMRSQVEASSSIQDSVKAQIASVLDFVDDSLQYVQHERRKEISLAEFMRRHHYLNTTVL
jgi:hypothetical protein